MRSTSIHSLNADQGLSPFLKIVYLLLNWINNLFPYSNLDRRIEFKDFTVSDLENKWSKTHRNSSASRKFSDLFWMSLPWDKISNQLGGINIFDTGCGSGNYGLRINEASGGRVKTYTGVDAKEKPNWKEIQSKNLNFKLIQSRSSDISKLIPDNVSLFITQTAIEHFDSDISFFEQIKNYIDKSNRPILQVHIFPASATLPLYLFHGIRQYNPRNISKITKIFDKNHKFLLYGLGGDKSKKMHFRYFTWPVLITRKFNKPTFDEEEYDRELFSAVRHDLENQSKSPLFWALIIESNFSN
ncbi:MAG: hypothetical protein WA051_03180 [Minisyncoccia bacterium]